MTQTPHQQREDEGEDTLPVFDIAKGQVGDTNTNWESEFAVLFNNGQFGWESLPNGAKTPVIKYIPALKDFICGLLTTAKEEAYRTGLEDGVLKLGETARKNYQMGYNEAKEEERAEMAKIIGEHNARILNEYQLQEMGDERRLFPVIEEATKQTLATLQDKGEEI